MIAFGFLLRLFIAVANDVQLLAIYGFEKTRMRDGFKAMDGCTIVIYGSPLGTKTNKNHKNKRKKRKKKEKKKLTVATVPKSNRAMYL